MSESYVHGRCIEWCMFNWEDVYGISYLCEVLHQCGFSNSLLLHMMNFCVWLGLWMNGVVRVSFCRLCPK